MDRKHFKSKDPFDTSLQIQDIEIISLIFWTRKLKLEEVV